MTPKGLWNKVTNLPWIQLDRVMVKIRSHQFKHFEICTELV